MMTMLEKIKNAILDANALALFWITQNSARLIGLLVAGLICLGAYLIYLGSFSGALQYPTSVKEYAATSVIIMDKEQSRGGSGVILRSAPGQSEILTNKHVCELTQGGGFVVKNNEYYVVEAIKKYPFHDLCLVKVMHNFNVTTTVAPNSPETYASANISGHPGLLPHVLTQGNFSGYEVISLIVGQRPCTKEDWDNRGMTCFFYGGIPIIETFRSQVVTGIILPGSSGSGVFNTKGEIVGLAFASRGNGLNFAYIVPHGYLVNFIDIESVYSYIPVKNYKGNDKVIKALKQQGADKRNAGYLIWEKK